MDKRLTWEEIEKQYPDQWVGLSKVEWDGEAPNVRSAIVEYAGSSDDEPLARQIAGEDIFTTYTGADTMCPMGVLSVMP